MTSFNITKGMAMIDAYEKVRGLTPDEIAALPVLRAAQRCASR